jgi:hypothetical protein
VINAERRGIRAWRARGVIRAGHAGAAMGQPAGGERDERYVEAREGEPRACLGCQAVGGPLSACALAEASGGPGPVVDPPEPVRSHTHEAKP